MQAYCLSAVNLRLAVGHGSLENQIYFLAVPLGRKVELVLVFALLVGYAFGHFYTTEKKTSCIDVGSRCFDLDELFVLPEYRSQGLGRALFRAIEAFSRGEAQYFTLSTATKDYKKILKFYVEDNGMFFHDAFLIKEFPGK